VTGKESGAYTNTLNNIGNVYKKLGKLTEALEYLNRAMNIKNKFK